MNYSFQKATEADMTGLKDLRRISRYSLEVVKLLEYVKLNNTVEEEGLTYTDGVADALHYVLGSPNDLIIKAYIRDKERS